MKYVIWVVALVVISLGCGQDTQVKTPVGFVGGGDTIQVDPIWDKNQSFTVQLNGKDNLTGYSISLTRLHGGTDIESGYSLLQWEVHAGQSHLIGQEFTLGKYKDQTVFRENLVPYDRSGSYAEHVVIVGNISKEDTDSIFVGEDYPTWDDLFND